MYYKLINGLSIVGAVSFNDFRKYQRKHGLVLLSDIDTAQYVEYKNVYYRDNWLKATITDSVPYVEVSIIEIDENEYNALIEALDINEEIDIEEPEEQQEEYIEPTNEDEQATIEYIRNAKIAQMDKICNQTIEQGFDLVLDDNIEHHFSLTTQDQLNLITLSTQLASGETSIPYHADGELCRFFSANEVQDLIEVATLHKTYHITYFNALRAYIDSLDTIEAISAATYGMPLAEEYQSDVMKYLFGT